MGRSAGSVGAGVGVLWSGVCGPRLVCLRGVMLCTGWPGAADVACPARGNAKVSVTAACRFRYEARVLGCHPGPKAARNPQSYEGRKESYACLDDTLIRTTGSPSARVRGPYVVCQAAAGSSAGVGLQVLDRHESTSW